MRDRDLYLEGWRDGWAGREPQSNHPDYEDGHLAGEGEWAAVVKREEQRD